MNNTCKIPSTVQLQVLRYTLITAPRLLSSDEEATLVSISRELEARNVLSNVLSIGLNF